MPEVQFERVTDDPYLRELLDAADEGRPAAVVRQNCSTALVDRHRSVSCLMALNADRIELVSDGNSWIAVITASPIAAEGEDVADAVDELIEALRGYAEDWSERLRSTPNHQQNWGLVQLIDHSSDDELRTWIIGS